MSRILFVLPESGYLRAYSTTVLALATRGHEVTLAYERPDKTERDNQSLADAPPTLQIVGSVPAHGGSWRQPLIDLGCAIDYVRFLSRRHGTPYLRGRMDKYVPKRMAWLRTVDTWPDWWVKALRIVSTWIERSVPADPALVQFIREHRPDAVVISPLVLRGPGGAQQTQFVKAVRESGVPVALAVGSWDHLSSKGFVRIEPDMVLVWNEVQKQEAVRMHGLPAERITVTGAQLFDLWFGRQPTLSREDFLARVGLPADRSMILYAGSSRGIADPAVEIPFVRNWVQAIRRSPDPAVRGAAVLVRPHVTNVTAWAEVSLANFGAVSIWPRQRPTMPMNELETSDYFHSLFHSSAVVGINTSAMIEATIIGRPVLTVQAPDFAATQQGTVHFRYLIPSGGGSVETAATLDEHLEQLAIAVASPERSRRARERFVQNFVRPHGLERDALDFVVAAIERLPGVHARPMRPNPRSLAPFRWMLRVAFAPPRTGR